MQSKQYDSLELKFVFKVLSSQSFSGISHLKTQEAWGNRRTCSLIWRNGELVYGGLTVPNNLKFAEMLGKKYQPGLINAAIQTVSEKLDNSASFREILELLVKIRVFSWEQIEKLVYKKTVLHLDSFWQHSGIVNWETSTEFDLSYGEDRHGFQWFKLQQELNHRQQLWQQLSNFVPSMDAVPHITKNFSNISDSQISQHLQKYVDGNRSLLNIAEQLDKDPLAIARTYSNWVKLDWLEFDRPKIKDTGDTSTISNDTSEKQEEVSLPMILSVDDSPIVQKTIERALSNSYNVVLTDNAIDALAILKRHPIQLVLLDLTMPDIDGLKFCKTIKKIPKFSDLPIVMVTARDGLLDKMKGHMAGTDKYLTKPFNPEELREVVNKYVNKNVT